MVFKEIQRNVDEWTSQFEPQYWPPYEMLASLTEEVGEISREINHTYGNKKKKKDEKDNSIGKELTDIIFTVVCMANSEGIDLSKEWENMINYKLYKRDNERFEKK
ncbi:MAG: MazG nucleotide pyrophosphohydrolase domain-containing protein [archaeon]